MEDNVIVRKKMSETEDVYYELEVQSDALDDLGGGENIFMEKCHRRFGDFLDVFDGDNHPIFEWIYQMNTLKRLYQLDDAATRVFISSKLRGRAATWFFSNYEHLSLKTNELLKKMILEFGQHRPSPLMAGSRLVPRRTPQTLERKKRYSTPTMLNSPHAKRINAIIDDINKTIKFP